MHGNSKHSRFGLLFVVFTLTTFLSCSKKETPAEPPQDVTPPAAVTDLTCFNPETSSIALRWTAPGDDGSNGTASQYDFRYSTSLINDANWPSASQVAGEPLPKAAGNAETLIVSDLSPSTTYYFAMKTGDEIPNWSALSNIAYDATQALIDTIPPAAVNDLMVIDSTESSIILQWTAPGDDDNSGRASTYDVRFSNSPITSANWMSAWQTAGEPLPKIAGSTETFRVMGLLPSSNYFFALKTRDEMSNWSALSNVINAGTKQAYSWSSLGSGMNHHVIALTVYDGYLIAGGDFTTAGEIPANRIAAWDGDSWSPLGSGLSGDNPPPMFFALTVFNDLLIAGGDFTIAGGIAANYIAAWDGSSWSPLGTGTDEGVSCLTVYQGQLIAGGAFSTAGGVPANRIAAWDGDTWSPLGTGTAGSMNNFVYAIAVYDDKLIVGGAFTHAGGVSVNNIAAWNGSTWSSLGSGMSGGITEFVFGLTEYNNELIAGGWFTSAGGVSTNYIAAWDGGSWSPLGSGMNDAVGPFTVFNGQLIAGGAFTTAGGVSANLIASWDNASWSPLGAGLSGSSYPYVHALTVYNGQLIAAGRFTIAGSISANYIAAWGE